MRLRFLARCRDQLATLRVAAHNWQAAVAASDEQLLNVAHSLAGGGGTFGFPGLSERASRLEALLSEDTEFDPVEARAALDALVLELERILD